MTGSFGCEAARRLTGGGGMGGLGRRRDDRGSWRSRCRSLGSISTSASSIPNGVVGKRKLRRAMNAMDQPRAVAKRFRLLPLVLIATCGCPSAALATWTDPIRDFHDGRVLVIGDSHTFLGGKGEQYPRWDTDCQIGRTSSQGVKVLAADLRHRHRKVVFDLGTNDAAEQGGFRDNLRRAWRIADGRDLWLVTSYRGPPFGLTPMRTVNRASRRFVARHPHHAHLINWRAAVKPAMTLADDVHFTPRGYRIRTRLIRRSVRDPATGGSRRPPRTGASS